MKLEIDNVSKTYRGNVVALRSFRYFAAKLVFFVFNDMLGSFATL